jgi:PTS system nitrogen regulatory IIA component
MDIADYVHQDLIVFLDAETRDQALKKMIEELHRAAKVDDSEAFYQAVVEREKIVSTGIGMGIAIPHAKLSSYDQFFIAIGVLSAGVDWKALDNAPVRLIFLLGGPDDKQTEYLQILSSLTSFIKDEERRKKFLMLNSKEDMIGLFKSP